MLLQVILLALVAAVCGSLGAAIAGRDAGGCLRAIALGLIGAAIGTVIGRHAGLPRILSYRDFPIVWAIMGSALFVALLSLFSRSRKDS